MSQETLHVHGCIYHLPLHYYCSIRGMCITIQWFRNLRRFGQVHKTVKNVRIRNYLFLFTYKKLTTVPRILIKSLTFMSILLQTFRSSSQKSYKCPYQKLSLTLHTQETDNCSKNSYKISDVYQHFTSDVSVKFTKQLKMCISEIIFLSSHTRNWQLFQEFL